MTINTSSKPILMNLGTYQFEINTAAYQALRRNTSYRWQKQDRLTRQPAQQYIGAGDDQIPLNGRIYPQFAGGLGQLDRMRQEAARATKLSLIDGMGKVYGQYVITKITEMQSNIMYGGKPRRIDFTVALMAYGEDLVTGGSSGNTGGNNNSGGGYSLWDLIGDVTNVLDNIA